MAAVTKIAQDRFLHEVNSKLNKNRPVKFASISKTIKEWSRMGNKYYLSGGCDMG